MVRVVGKVAARAWGPDMGIVQCIDAAEVFVGVMALRLGAPPILLDSDSSFFVDGWGRGKSWCTAVGRSHADVWRQFWRVAEDFGVEAITVVKVKGHATQAMFEGGLVNDVGRWGNAQADDAAKRGAALHPDVSCTVEAIQAQRLDATLCALWLGVGLEAAQQRGALPKELTASQKTDRPRGKPSKKVEIVRDDVWHAEQRQTHWTEGAHPSHAMNRLGPFFFCARCGCYGAQRLVSLAAPCPMETTPSRRYLLNRLLDGRHPRTNPLVRSAPAQCDQASTLECMRMLMGIGVITVDGATVT